MGGRSRATVSAARAAAASRGIRPCRRVGRDGINHQSAADSDGLPASADTLRGFAATVRASRAKGTRRISTGIHAGGLRATLWLLAGQHRATGLHATSIAPAGEASGTATAGAISYAHAAVTNVTGLALHVRARVDAYTELTDVTYRAHDTAAGFHTGTRTADLAWITHDVPTGWLDAMTRRVALLAEWAAKLPSATGSNTLSTNADEVILTEIAVVHQAVTIVVDLVTGLRSFGKFLFADDPTTDLTVRKARATETELSCLAGDSSIWTADSAN